MQTQLQKYNNLEFKKTKYNDTLCSICGMWFNNKNFTHVEGFKHQCFICVNKMCDKF